MSTATQEKPPIPVEQRRSRPIRWGVWRGPTPRAAAQTPLAPPPRQPWTRRDTWVFLLGGLLAAVSRFISVGAISSKGTPIFDEKHYVPQAFDMVASSINPITGGIEFNPGFGLVVHPPLAKQIIALSESVFGYTPLGWRFMSALFGTACVLLIMAMARRLSRSTFGAFAAGILAITDGVLLIASRVGMLDIFQVFFLIAAAYFFILDQDSVYKRLYQAQQNGLDPSLWGPRMGFRWWRFATGIMLGLALSVKWSGLYYMAAFGILTVIMDARLRKRIGAVQPVRGMLVLDAAVAFMSLVIVPVALYIWSWRAWFSSETAVYRHSKSMGEIQSWFRVLPEPLAGWLYYHQRVLNFHSSLTNSAGHHHTWESKPWAWLFSARGLLYYSNNDATGCGDEQCKSIILLLGLPALWWLTAFIVLWALWSIVVRRASNYIVPTVAWMAGFVPWLIAFDRQMYFFYATAFVPFTIVMAACILTELSRTGRIRQGRIFAGEPTGMALACGYLSLIGVLFVYFLPIYYGISIPAWLYQSMMWLPSWH